MKVAWHQGGKCLPQRKPSYNLLMKRKEERTHSLACVCVCNMCAVYMYSTVLTLSIFSYVSPWQIFNSLVQISVPQGNCRTHYNRKSTGQKTAQTSGSIHGRVTGSTGHLPDVHVSPFQFSSISIFLHYDTDTSLIISWLPSKCSLSLFSVHCFHTSPYFSSLLHSQTGFQAFSKLIDL